MGYLCAADRVAGGPGIRDRPARTIAGWPDRHPDRTFALYQRTGRSVPSAPASCPGRCRGGRGRHRHRRRSAPDRAELQRSQSGARGDRSAGAPARGRKTARFRRCDAHRVRSLRQVASGGSRLEKTAGRGWSLQAVGHRGGACRTRLPAHPDRGRRHDDLGLPRRRSARPAACLRGAVRAGLGTRRPVPAADRTGRSGSASAGACA